MTLWHRFVASSDDDNECSRAECGLIVCDDVLEQITVGCPAPTCTDEFNSDGRCVMVPGPHAPECAYCGRMGANPDIEADDDLLDSEADAILAMADADLAMADADLAYASITEEYDAP